jgi:hypothetical protein
MEVRMASCVLASVVASAPAAAELKPDAASPNTIIPLVA